MILSYRNTKGRNRSDSRQHCRKTICRPRRSPRYHRQSRGGFTLLEVISAMTLLVVGAFSVFSLLLTAIQMDMQSAHFSSARSIAQQQIEYVRSLSWNTITGLYNSQTFDANGIPQGLAAPLSNSQPASPFTYRMLSQLPAGAATVTFGNAVTGANTSYRDVIVTVKWIEPGRGQSSVTNDTLVTDGGINSL